MYLKRTLQGGSLYEIYTLQLYEHQVCNVLMLVSKIFLGFTLFSIYSCAFIEPVKVYPHIQSLNCSVSGDFVQLTCTRSSISRCRFEGQITVHLSRDCCKTQFRVVSICFRKHIFLISPIAFLLLLYILYCQSFFLLLAIYALNCLSFSPSFVIYKVFPIELNCHVYV